MLRKISFVAAALALSLGAAHAQTQSSPAKPVEGAAKSCYFEPGPTGDVLVGRGGLACGKGSSLTFRLETRNDYLIEQVCDLSLPIRRTKIGSLPTDESVGCIFTGEVADPARKFRGGNVTIAPPRDNKQ